jgi:S-DNA-T family DNA segregation ATPase FtsK/SpoIIIE
MAKKAGKSSGKAKGGNISKGEVKELKQEKGESVNLRQLAKDERTWKITGVIAILVSIFLFIAFAPIFLPGKKIRIKYSEGLLCSWRMM